VDRSENPVDPGENLVDPAENPLGTLDFSVDPGADPLGTLDFTLGNLDFSVDLSPNPLGRLDFLATLPAFPPSHRRDQEWEIRARTEGSRIGARGRGFQDLASRINGLAARGDSARRPLRASLCVPAESPRTPR